MSAPPKIVFLDQNKWIDLTHALVDSDPDSELLRLGRNLIDAIVAGKVLFPLTSNLIIETYRMANGEKRGQLSEVQAKFSQGYVFRNRDERIRHELEIFFRSEEQMPAPTFPHFWWLSKGFVEAFVSRRQLALEELLEPDQILGIQSDPKYALYHWLATAPPDERQTTMELFSEASADLIARIQKRIERLRGQDFSMRKKIYGAQMFLDDLPRILDVSNDLEVTWLSAALEDGKKIRRIVREVPTYHAEIELVIRIESMNRSLQQNDLRDMDSFVAAIPYADMIIGEKMFVNMAQQAKLDAKFGCKLETDLFQLAQFV